MQLFLYMFDGSPVAYAAHLGGFVAGAGIAWMIRPGRTFRDEQHGTDDISSLRPLCTTASLKEMYHYAENAKDRETREIWTERILKDVRCPVCGSPIKKRGKGFKCTNDHTI